MRAGSGAVVTADTALRGNLGGSSSNVSDESCHVFIQLVANVGGRWLGSLQLAGHQGPESALARDVCTAKREKKKKSPVLRHIAEGCRQHGERMNEPTADISALCLC